MKRAITKLPPEVGWQILRAVGDEYDHLQDARKRAGNRQGALTRKSEQALHDHGMSMAELLDVDITARLLELEKDVDRALRRTYRQTVPNCIIEWQEAQTGVGDLQLARLLGHMGHPRIAQPYRWVGAGAHRHLVADEPFERTVSQLVAYCGRTGDPLRRKRVGMSAEEAFGGGKPALKMITYLIAESVKQSGVRKIGEPDDSVRYDVEARKAISPWGQRYLDLRREHQERLDWSPKHQDQAALHRIAKELVKQLWAVAGDDPALPELRAQIVIGPGRTLTDTRLPSAGADHNSTAAATSTSTTTPKRRTTPPPQPRRLVRKRSS